MQAFFFPTILTPLYYPKETSIIIIIASKLNR